MAVVLNSAEKRVLRGASATAIELELKAIRRYLRRGSWLGSTNRYEADDQALRRAIKRGLAIRQRNLTQVVAAAGLRHNLDGWSYLGSAIYATARGDTDHGIHLGYYAALRAALSLLATQGVGVFNRDHFAVSAVGRATRIPAQRGTHQMAWLALQHWAGLERSADGIASVISPGRIPLDTWLTAGFGGTPWRRVGSAWLELWGSDLRVMANDQRLRNEASYRPGGKRLTAPPAATTGKFLQDIWGALEPSPSSPFDRLDRHLVRLAVDQVFFETTTPPRTRAKREAVVDGLLRNLPTPPTGFDWRAFLLRDIEPTDVPVLGMALGRLAPNSEHLAVVSRALLLLRVATGFGARARKAAEVSRGDLQFWWLPVLHDRGLWDAAAPPADFVDLWSDAADATLDLASWLPPAIGPQTYRTLASERADAVHALAGTERACMWGLEL